MSTTPISGPGSGKRSRSEVSIGARLSKIRDLITLLATFEPAYTPGPTDLATAELNTLHGSADTRHKAAVAAKHAEKVTLDTRAKLFGFPARGLKARASDIRKAVQAAYSRNSPQYMAVDKFIDQLQGTVPKGSGGEGTSQAQTSYAAKTQAYADLIDILLSYGDGYAPAKADIQFGALRDHLSNIRTANADAAAKSLAAREAEDRRDADLGTLAARLQRVKAAVSSQYDYGSAQEKALRKLKV